MGEVCKCCGQPLPKDDGIPYKAIIDDLNRSTGRKYRDNQATRRLIRGRIAEGYTLEDFKKVHATKASQWRDDLKMRAYLRPNTLYAASKFDSYLNEFSDTPIPSGPNGMKAHEAWGLFKRCMEQAPTGRLLIQCDDKDQQRMIVHILQVGFRTVGGWDVVQKYSENEIYKMFIDAYLGIPPQLPAQAPDFKTRSANDDSSPEA